MSRKMTLSEFQQREFEREVKKQLILAREQQQVATACEEVMLKRILRAYRVAEMRTALREEQQGGE